MSNVALWVRLICLFVLILRSAFFSLTETTLMAINRHRLRCLAKRGNTLAITTLGLLVRVNKLLSVLLIANTLINAMIAALVISLAIETFGNDNKVIMTAAVIMAFLLILFAEISPKVIGATDPERISLPASAILGPLITFGQPMIWFVSRFVTVLLRLLRIDANNQVAEHRVSPKELCSIILEGSP